MQHAIKKFKQIKYNTPLFSPLDIYTIDKESMCFSEKDIILVAANHTIWNTEFDVVL